MSFLGDINVFHYRKHLRLYFLVLYCLQKNIWSINSKNEIFEDQNKTFKIMAERVTDKINK